MNLTLITAPVCEPVTLAELEGQTRLGGQLSAEADTVELMISAVREAAEGVTNRALVSQVWELSLDNFPLGRNAIYLPMPPLQSVQFVKYIDTEGTEQTLDTITYRVVAEIAPNCGNGYVLPAYGLNWPATRNDVATVIIRFTCGYGPIGEDTALNVPKGIIQWILLNCANLFENRESVGIGMRGETVLDLTATLADGLVSKYRIPRL